MCGFFSLYNSYFRYMSTFLADLVHHILKENQKLSNIVFVLPSKRAGIFLKKEIKSKLDGAIIIPKIISIEDFVQELSSLTTIDNTTLLFEFYTIYQQYTKKENLETFDVFSKWATVALQDFNEIDRHLIDANYIFSYLKDIDRIEKWSLEKNYDKTYINNYLSFFDQLHLYYSKLQEQLLNKKLAYQGLQYKEAYENIHNYINSRPKDTLVFAGFNALNKAEELIIQQLITEELATVFWDTDSYYFHNHTASNFFKKYREKWSYFKEHPFNWINNNFNKTKNIKVIGAPKNNTQIKYVGEILNELYNEKQNFENTAVVLSDESLLPATLTSLPKVVERANITMGYDLMNMSISSLVESIFKLHVNSKNKHKFYYKYVVEILTHPIIKSFANTNNAVDEIHKNNLIYLDYTILKKINPKIEKLGYLFSNWNDNPNTALDNCIKFIENLKNEIKNKIELEFLFKNLTVLNQLKSLNDAYNYVKDIKTLHQLFKQIIRTKKLSFQGEPLTGLQLMGVLETRVLDFENIILTSVNEGILPKGKSENSFIPFDVKKEVGLPTYQERDAIFSYHFFRLIQRAKNIYLLYNTENDSFGAGEQSRFITDLEINSNHTIKKIIVSPKVNSAVNTSREVKKTNEVYVKLLEIAEKGFSPTSLTSYINNPIDFYTQKILGIKQTEEAEETIAANTLGTVIHKTLEAFYLPYKDQFLKAENILSMKKSVKNETEKWFKKVYKNGDVSMGKNLLIYNVAIQFITNFLNKELQQLKNGRQIKILALEYDLESDIVIDGIEQPVKLIGQADRIDLFDGTIRIIDYKTGSVLQRELMVKDWSIITSDYKKYSKVFQLLQYAFIYTNMNKIDVDTTPLESGIISFKNLNTGFLKVNKTTITKNDLEEFQITLKKLIHEIFNTDLPFIENANKSF